MAFAYYTPQGSNLVLGSACAFAGLCDLLRSGLEACAQLSLACGCTLTFSAPRVAKGLSLSVGQARRKSRMCVVGRLALGLESCLIAFEGCTLGSCGSACICQGLVSLGNHVREALGGALLLGSQCGAHGRQLRREVELARARRLAHVLELRHITKVRSFSALPRADL